MKIIRKIKHLYARLTATKLAKEYYLIHSIDSLDVNNSVNEYDIMKQFKNINTTEYHEGDEHEYSYLFTEQNEEPQDILYHIKYAGVLTLDELQEYLTEFSYLENEGCETMGSLTEYGLLSDISLQYFDSYTNIQDSVRISPLAITKKQFNNSIEFINSKL